MNSLVSVIVPVYNKEDVLSRCLNSIKNQSYTYFEVLLVNDGSKDKSLPILKQYESNDDRFHVVDKVNGGASSARNVGLDYARGNIFVLWIQMIILNLIILKDCTMLFNKQIWLFVDIIEFMEIEM